MTSRASAEFWRCYRALPAAVRQQARKQFRAWLRNPSHPSVEFKQIRIGVWSARVSLQYRALARRNRDDVLWFWIGTHAEYDRSLR
jgi:hypothetical protein